MAVAPLECESGSLLGATQLIGASPVNGPLRELVYLYRDRLAEGSVRFLELLADDVRAIHCAGSFDPRTHSGTVSVDTPASAHSSP